jgi:membrane protein implicated in regulation of membrane protease activity
VKRLANLKAYMIMSGVAAAFVGLIVLYGTRFWETAVIWSLVTFIASLVIVATLDLSFKPDDQDPNRPRLH